MKKHETIDLTESRILVEKQSKELIDSIKDHCTKLNRFNLKHVGMILTYFFYNFATIVRGFWCVDKVARITT